MHVSGIISVVATGMCMRWLFSQHDAAPAADLDVTWNWLLGRFVSATENGDSTTIDHAGVQGQRARLRSYLDRISEVEAKTFAAWRESERLAFLINAYNA